MVFGAYDSYPNEFNEHINMLVRWPVPRFSVFTVDSPGLVAKDRKRIRKCNVGN